VVMRRFVLSWRSLGVVIAFTAIRKDFRRSFLIGLVGLAPPVAIARLIGQGFRCEPYGTLSASSSAICSRYVVGCNLSEEVAVMLNTGANGSVVVGANPQYQPITGL
jgi:hypothetical protein